MFFFEVKCFYLRQHSVHAFLCSRTAFKAVENCEKLLFFLKNCPVLTFSPILQQLLPFLQIRNKKGALHLLLFIFFELKSFEVKSLKEVFASDLAPIFNSMNFLNIFQLIDLRKHSISKNTAGF